MINVKKTRYTWFTLNEWATSTEKYILIMITYKYINTWGEKSLFKLREVSIYREVKVGGLCRFPMWDFAHVVVEECLPSA
mgnify:CR=1 FL=1